MTSYFIGGQFEIKDSVVKKDYSIAGMTVAVNDGTAERYTVRACGLRIRTN